MSQSVKHQVFVSSTFTDLIEERAEVIQALWELDCIPVGMEAFLATSESQWSVIKKIIEECDYYILIIGGRYGSLAEEGVSYTEKEYNFAKEIGLPILGFSHSDPGKISLDKSEKDDNARVRLEQFRARVLSERPIRTWATPQELGGLVSRSVSREIKVNPRPGWVRNSGQSSLELLEQVNSLTTENSQLRQKVSADNIGGVNIADLAQGSDKIELVGSAQVFSDESSAYRTESVRWTAEASWDDVFRELGPVLMNEATEDAIRSSLARFIGWSSAIDFEKQSVRSRTISQETFAEVIVQFRALGLINRGIRKRAVSDRSSYWSLTDKGERYLVNLLARRKMGAIKTLPNEGVGVFS